MSAKILNEFIDLLFQYWDGKITQEEFEKNRFLYISKETDDEMRKDSFY